MTRRPKPPARPRPENEPDAEPAGKKPDQARKCLVTGEVRPKSELIRFVVTPDETVIADLSERLPGRGLWASADREILARAVQKNLFARAARQAVKTAPDLTETTHRQLRERCLNGLGLLMRAGHLVTGQTKVLALLHKEVPAFVIEATDGAPDGRGKVLALARARSADKKRPLTVVGCFTSDEIGLALGRENVIHAAGPWNGMAARWLVSIKRLSGFEPLEPEIWNGAGTDRPSRTAEGASA